MKLGVKVGVADSVENIVTMANIIQLVICLWEKLAFILYESKETQRESGKQYWTIPQSR